MDVALAVGGGEPAGSWSCRSSSCTVASVVGGAVCVGTLGLALTGTSELDACLSGWACVVGLVLLSWRCQRPGRGVWVAVWVVGWVVGWAVGWVVGWLLGGNASPDPLEVAEVGRACDATGFPCMWVSVNIR